MADERETAILMHRHLMTTSFEEGGARGRAEGLRIAIHSMCSLLGIQPDSAQLARIAELDADQLTSVVETLATERTLPELL